MRRSAGAALVAALLAGGVALASDPPLPAAPVPAATPELRAYVVAQLDAQLASVRRARAAVDAKLAGTTDERARRARAAYKLLRGGAAPAWADTDERMATARRRAAARWLLARDRREEDLLAAEAGALAAADARLVRERTRALVVPLPPAGLARPVDGPGVAIARRFGAFVHDDTKATLTRRGLDLDVPEGAAVRAVEGGVVAYVGPLRGLDHGVVVDHGAFVTVTAKLDPPSLAAGDRVARGDRLGRPARRRVYLEVRVPVGAGGTPVDPEPLLGK